MGVVEANADVRVPARVAYDQWTQVERFPRFIPLVKRVDQVQPAVTRWLVGAGPVRRELYAEIRERQPHSLVAWRTLGRRLPHDGEASFVPVSSDHTAVRITLRFATEGLLGRLLHVIARRSIRSTLARFASFVEAVADDAETPRCPIRNGRVLAPEREASDHPGWVHG